ncbi:MAG TPA: glycosyltransferase family 4 protein [Flavobacterium sp.]
MQADKINFIDISVYDRQIKSVAEEKSSTAHSVGYLDHLHQDIHPVVIRFGAKYETSGIYQLYRYSFRDLLVLFQFMKANRPAVVLFHSFRFPIRFLLLKLLLGTNTKFIIQHHAEKPSPNVVKCLIQRICYGYATRFMFVSREQAAPFIMSGIIKSEKDISEIMECSSSFSLQDQKNARQGLDIPHNRRIFIWVGHLNSNKDPMCMFQALDMYKQKGNDFLLYVFFGQTDLLAEVQDFISRKDLSQNVKLMGKIQNCELEQWFNAADFYISCSQYEGSGIALAEAMSCGCIPIVSNIPSFRHMTANGEAGFLFTAGSAESLAENLQRANDSDVPAGRLQARKVFELLLSFDTIGGRVSALVRELHS